MFWTIVKIGQNTTGPHRPPTLSEDLLPLKGKRYCMTFIFTMYLFSSEVNMESGVKNGRRKGRGDRGKKGHRVVKKPGTKYGREREGYVDNILEHTQPTW